MLNYIDSSSDGDASVGVIHTLFGEFIYMEKLKEKLLSLGVFLDNEYLDFYCTLIVNNKSTAIEKFKTQKHHIIPKTYYKLNSLNIDNSCDNIVNLLYSDHILAHYYLCLCVDSTNKSLAYRLQNSFLHLIKADANNKQKIEAFNVNDLPLYQEIYTNWKILNSKLQIPLLHGGFNYYPDKDSNSKSNSIKTESIQIMFI